VTRGQSEVLGFVFVFSLIVLTVAAVYAGGFPALQDARDAERIENMERAFEVLDDNIADIMRHEAPSRATEVRLTGGRMELGTNTSLSVRVANTSNASRNLTFSERARPITYTDEDTTFALSFGALLRSDRGNPAMLSGPGWIIGPERSVVPIPQFVPGGDRGLASGDTTILLIAKAGASRSVRSFNPDNGARANVTITVSSERAAAWGRYLEANGMTEIDGNPSDDEVSYWYETDAVYFPKQRISIRFSF
jgi:hypothetical protein